MGYKFTKVKDEEFRKYNFGYDMKLMPIPKDMEKFNKLCADAKNKNNMEELHKQWDELYNYVTDTNKQEFINRFNEDIKSSEYWFEDICGKSFSLEVYDIQRVERKKLSILYKLTVLNSETSAYPTNSRFYSDLQNRIYTYLFKRYNITFTYKIENEDFTIYFHPGMMDLIHEMKDSKPIKDSFMTTDEINKRLSNEISKDLTFDSYDIYASEDEFNLELHFKYKNKYDTQFDVEGEVTDTFKEDYGEGVEYKINIINYDYDNDIPDEEIDNVEKILKKLEKSVLLDDIIKMCDEDIQREVLERIDENNHNFEEEMKSYRDSKQVNDNVISLLNQLQSSLKGAYNLASGLKQQLPQQQPTTNEEKTLYNGKFITSLENIADSVSRWYKEIEQYKKEFEKAHIVIEEVIESFPLEARTKLRESENPEETYKELVEDLKNRYNSLPNKEDYKEQVIKMKKDLDEFYKNTFKK